MRPIQIGIILNYFHTQLLGTLRLRTVCKLYAKLYATCFQKNKRKQSEFKIMGRSAAGSFLLSLMKSKIVIQLTSESFSKF